MSVTSPLFLSVGLIIADIFNSGVLGVRTMTNVTLHGVTDKLDDENAAKYGSALESAVASFKEVEALFADSDFHSRRGWFRYEENDEGDVVYAKDTPKGRMVTIQTELPLPPDVVMRETWDGMETLPKWNQNINYAKVLAALTPNFDVVMYGNNDVLVVSGRDFVSTRIWRDTSANGFMLASRSVELAAYPKQKGKVRAHLHLAGARFLPHPKKSGKTLADVVMLADLKGMLPKFLVDKVLGKIMLMDTITNRKHFEDIKKEREGHKSAS